MDVLAYLPQLTYWHWFILAVAFVILELVLPGVVFLWIGIAAAITGLIKLAFSGLQWEYQILAFGVLTVVCTIGARLWVRQRPTETDRPTLNRRGEQYVGRRFTLAEPIVNNIGKLRVDDTTWKITGPDIAAGATVKVKGVDGTSLVVEKQES
jgi:inner membrane protein